jgi:hypothetical protein
MIELSKEMYCFDPDGFMQFEKCLIFLKSFFERCKNEGNTHEIVIIISSRLYYPQATDPKSLINFANQQSTKILSESFLDDTCAFQISKHTKVF